MYAHVSRQYLKGFFHDYIDDETEIITPVNV